MRVALLLFVICVTVGLIFLIRHQTPALQASPVSSPISPPITLPAARNPNGGDQVKSKVAKEPKPEEETHSSMEEQNARISPLKKKTKSGRLISKKRLESLSSSEDIFNFLDDVRFDSIRYFYQDVDLKKEDPQHPDPNLNSVKGAFAGPVNDVTTQQKIWDMRMDFDGFKDQVLEVRTRIEVAEDGQNYHIPPGDNYNLRDIDNLGFVTHSTGLGGGGFFEMFYLPQKDVFVGNWYSGTWDAMKPNGTLVLYRVQTMDSPTAGN
jgi:hypothetical protein